MTDQPILGINTEASLLSHVLSINNVLQQEKGIGTLKADSPDVRALVEKLHISQIQAVLFSIVLNIQDDESVSMSDMAQSIKTSTLMIQQYINDFDVLIEKRLLRKYQNAPGRRSAYASHNKSTVSTFRVPKNVIEALNHNEEWMPPTHTGLSFEDFIETLDSLFEQRIGDDIGYETLRFEIAHLVKDNPHLDFVKSVKDFNLNEEDMILLLAFVSQTIDNDQKISTHTMNDIFDYRHRRIWRDILNEKNSLQKLSLIENASHEGLGDDKFFTLTQKAKDDLIGVEITTTNTAGKKPKGWISWKDIKTKELIYNESEKDKITTLQKLLDKEQFNSVIARLEAGNMRLGFGCLFSGSVGVGKTETALQIARLTERDIVKVDISSTKTKWFGESEKLIKEVFNRYRGLVKSAKKNNENIPILFFNEADAIFSKRQTIGAEHNGPAQTENAIQNIILDELENLDGILIATTNLTKNFDDAFERRFLYKIDFSKPDKESRKAIWKSMIDDLSDDDTDTLAADYNFSGGEIENIARKRAVDMVIKGNTPSLKEVMTLCADEKLVKDTGKKIGFEIGENI